MYTYYERVRQLQPSPSPPGARAGRHECSRLGAEAARRGGRRDRLQARPRHTTGMNVYTGCCKKRVSILRLRRVT